MSDPINTARLIRAMEVVVRSGEQAIAGSDGETAIVAVECGKRLQGHPAALDLFDSLVWHRLGRRLRDLARRAPGPLTSELLEEVPRCLAVAWCGRIDRVFDVVDRALVTVAEDAPEIESLMHPEPFRWTGDCRP